VSGLFLISLLAACGPTEDSISVGLQSPNPAVREDMVKIARNVDSPVVVSALIDVLDDPAPDIRREAIDSLVNIGSTDAVPALIERLKDEDDFVQRAAVDALGTLGDPRATEALAGYLEERLEQSRVPASTVTIPLNAIWALGNIADPGGLEILAKLRDNPDPYVAYNANWALRQLKAGEG
jgi:HEAT repeat protein